MSVLPQSNRFKELYQLYTTAHQATQSLPGPLEELFPAYAEKVARCLTQQKLCLDSEKHLAAVNKLVEERQNRSIQSIQENASMPVIDRVARLKAAMGRTLIVHELQVAEEARIEADTVHRKNLTKLHDFEAEQRDLEQRIESLLAQKGEQSTMPPPSPQYSTAPSSMYEVDQPDWWLDRQLNDWLPPEPFGEEGASVESLKLLDDSQADQHSTPYIPDSPIGSLLGNEATIEQEDSPPILFSPSNPQTQSPVLPGNVLAPSIATETDNDVYRNPPLDRFLLTEEAGNQMILNADQHSTPYIPDSPIGSLLGNEATIEQEDSPPILFSPSNRQTQSPVLPENVLASSIATETDKDAFCLRPILPDIVATPQTELDRQLEFTRQAIQTTLDRYREHLRRELLHAERTHLASVPQGLHHSRSISSDQGGQISERRAPMPPSRNMRPETTARVAKIRNMKSSRKDNLIKACILDIQRQLEHCRPKKATKEGLLAFPGDKE